MSAATDKGVLAIFDEEISAETIGALVLERGRVLVEARAAVAELIEAAASVERLATRQDGDERMFDRLHAALARCNGGAG